MKPPWDMARAAFLLLAAVSLVAMLETAFTLVGCWWLMWTTIFKAGDCASAGNNVRELFTEILTAVLALLLAGRTPPP
jgi:hypothetical protein